MKSIGLVPEIFSKKSDEETANMLKTSLSNYDNLDTDERKVVESVPPKEFIGFFFPEINEDTKYKIFLSFAAKCGK